MSLVDLITPWRVKAYSASVFFALTVGYVVALATGSGASTLTGRLGGDFPAFYSAGRLAASGDYEGIYDLGRMAEEQSKFLLAENGSVLPFSYPPHVALVYAPLSYFSYRTAYVTNTLIMAAALVAAILTIAKAYPEVSRYTPLVIALSFTYLPTMRSIFGGQNSAVSLLLISLIWLNSQRDREILAGIFSGLLLFKPQFAIPLIGLFALSGRWRTAITGLLVGLVTFTLSFALTGSLVLHWIEFAPGFSMIDAGINKANAISYLGFFEAVFGVSSVSASLLGWFFAGTTIVFLATTWFFAGRRIDFNLRIAATVPALVLIPSHVMYYDISICIVSLVALSENLGRKAEVAAAFWLLGWSQLFSSQIGASPLFFSAVALMTLAGWVLLGHRKGSWSSWI